MADTKAEQSSDNEAQQGIDVTVENGKAQLDQILHVHATKEEEVRVLRKIDRLYVHTLMQPS
jgi:hypothetical protein